MFPQGSVLSPLFFLIYANDLDKCIKHPKSYHFANHTNILQSSSSLIDLAKKVNYDLKKLCQWLKTNILCPKVVKKVIVFRSCSKKIDDSVRFKLDIKILIPTDSAMYLGVLLDDYLH